MTALKIGSPGIQALWIVKGKGSERAREILAIVEEKGIPVLYKDRAELDRLIPGKAHQGIVAIAERFEYSDLDGIISIHAVFQPLHCMWTSSPRPSVWEMPGSPQ